MRCPTGLLRYLALAGLVVGWICSVETASAQPSTKRKPLAQERLVMPLFPANWTEVFRENGPKELVEYVPTGQNAAAWQDKISL